MTRLCKEGTRMRTTEPQTKKALLHLLLLLMLLLLQL
jgi:hypothetical protein